MRYVCLGYAEEGAWEALSPSEQEAFAAACLAYDAELRENGHVVGGEALQNARTAATLQLQHGEVSVTDGPFAETKEQLCGLLVLEARDFNHAIQLMAKHPGLHLGCFEVRPTEEFPPE